MRMAQRGHIMANTLFLQQPFEQLAAEVGSHISNNGPWGAKSGKYVVFQESGDTLPFIICKCYGFHPF